MVSNGEYDFEIWTVHKNPKTEKFKIFEIGLRSNQGQTMMTS